MRPLSASLCKHLLLLSTLLLFSGCAAKYDFRDPITKTPFAFIKGGTYQMGNSKDEVARPVHEVTISDLFVGIYEVTFDQFDLFCKATSCEEPSDEGWGRKKRPVINISWHDATAYTEWLSKRSGQQYRLPSEAEWEYFARAGTTTAYWTGESLPQGSANCRGCGSRWDGKTTAPTGSFEPNPWGLYDTAGNVAEWVLDDYQRGYDGSPSDGTPLLLSGNTLKVQRGGSWNYLKKQAQSHYRDYIRLPRFSDTTGFRLVLVPDASTPIPKK